MENGGFPWDFTMIFHETMVISSGFSWGCFTFLKFDGFSWRFHGVHHDFHDDFVGDVMEY